MPILKGKIAQIYIIPEEQVEELLIGVKTPIHLSEAGEEIVEDVVEEKKVVQTRRCQPSTPIASRDQHIDDN